VAGATHSKQLVRKSVTGSAMASEMRPTTKLSSGRSSSGKVVQV
jgi:hypothetical protein